MTNSEDNELCDSCGHPMHRHIVVGPKSKDDPTISTSQCIVDKCSCKEFKK